MAFSPVVAYALAVSALIVAMAAVVYRTRPHARQNRSLALYLVSVGLSWGALVGLRIWLLPDHAASLGAGRASYVSANVGAFAYLVFLGTLDSGLSRPFRTRSGILATAFVTGALAATVVLIPDQWLGIDAGNEKVGPILAGFNLAFPIALFYALMVAVHAWRRASPGAARRQAGIFALAFAIHDAILMGFTVAAVTGVMPRISVNPILGVIPVTGVLILAAVLSYGLLFGQLFDAEVRLKVGIERGTVVSIVLGVFLVASVVLSEFLVDALGIGLGGIIAGLVLLAYKPLQRLGGRIADAALPHATGDEAYLTQRKADVYRVQFEEIMRDGSISAKERSALLKLQQSLGLDPGVANKIEAAVVG